MSGPEAPGQARAYVREALRNGHPPIPPGPLDDVVLVVSELVTNAFRYGTEPGDSLRVTVTLPPGTVRVEVSDTVRRHPHLRNESGERARGRGLHIVEVLALRWDVDERPFGKTVWAEVARP
jgi:two-component sensor histidine kinase